MLFYAQLVGSVNKFRAKERAKVQQKMHMGKFFQKRMHFCAKKVSYQINLVGMSDW
jgi:hypothetical protein